MGRKFDLIVFGASGFTGTFVVENIVKLVQSEDPGRKSLTWAVAGRSQKKLTDCLKDVSKETGADLRQIVTIEADVSNVASLRRMAAQGSVILNCVGPYQLFGENVVKACIAEGTHHVDLSGEPQFSEKMQVYYHREAEEKNSYIVGSCGFDSIPSDVGIAYLQQKFGGDLNSVEMFFESRAHHGHRPKIHYGTWHSLVHILNKMGELKELRKLLFPKPLPTPNYELKDRGLLHKSDKVKTWCVPFVGTDVYVVNRSQYHFHQMDKLRPVQMTAYFKIHYFILGILGLIFGSFVFALSKFNWGVKLLTNYPRLCSLGMVSHEGSSRDVLQALEFKFTFMGEGWADKPKGPKDEHSSPPNKKMNLIVKGRDPGYSATATMMVQSALTILEESSKMPSKGGVYPPGAAFAKTSLVDRLNSKGITFTLENPK